MPISTSPNAAVTLELRGPREDEHGFHVEDHEQQREHVVADLALRPAAADGVDAALVGERLLAGRVAWAHQCRDAEQQSGEQQGDRPEPDDREVVAQEVGHRATLLRRVNRLTKACSGGVGRPHGVALRRRLRIDLVDYGSTNLVDLPARLDRLTPLSRERPLQVPQVRQCWMQPTRRRNAASIPFGFAGSGHGARVQQRRHVGDDDCTRVRKREERGASPRWWPGSTN